MRLHISVRSFRASDMDRVLEIERVSFGPDAYDRNLFAELFHRCGDLFLVAATGRNICGYMVTCMRGRKAPDTAELVSVAVDPALRNQGAASSLMKNTLRRLQFRGAARLSLMVKVTNAEARRFYEGQGFRKVRKVAGYYEDGEDAVLMARQLR